jgi:hypothetical protein
LAIALVSFWPQKSYDIDPCRCAGVEVCGKGWSRVLPPDSLPLFRLVEKVGALRWFSFWGCR